MLAVHAAQDPWPRTVANALLADWQGAYPQFLIEPISCVRDGADYMESEFLCVLRYSSRSTGRQYAYRIKVLVDGTVMNSVRIPAGA